MQYHFLHQSCFTTQAVLDCAKATSRGEAADGQDKHHVRTSKFTPWQKEGHVQLHNSYTKGKCLRLQPPGNNVKRPSPSNDSIISSKLPPPNHDDPWTLSSDILVLSAFVWQKHPEQYCSDIFRCVWKDRESKWWKRRISMPTVIGIRIWICQLLKKEHSPSEFAGSRETRKISSQRYSDKAKD